MKRILWLLSAVCFVVVPTSRVSALSQAQRDIFDRGILYFNTDQSSDSCDVNRTTAVNLSDAVPEPYNTIISAAASAYNSNPQFVAAIFLSENANVWKPIDTNWGTSSKGAQGPFQFMPGTWDAYKVDGNNDGVKDINNIYDATYAAAWLTHVYNARPDSPLGSIDKPYQVNSLLQIAASYNWGPSNVQKYTNPDSPISGEGNKVPVETQNYLKNIYALMNSGLTKSGVDGWPDPVVNADNASSDTPVIYSCSSGVVAGSIVQTAIGLAWPEKHNPPLEATSAYLDAVSQLPRGPVSGGGADCAVFVSVVMRASGADTSYPIGNTREQQTYVENNPDKYDILTGINNTGDLQPGDILIVNQGSGAGALGHTLIYLGSQPGGNEASASQGDRMPSIGTVSSLEDDQNRGHYMVARLRG